MKKTTLITLFTIAIITLISTFFFHNSGSKLKKNVVEGIENFKPTANNNEERYLLFYPADSRTSQEVTIVREVTVTGEITKEYEVVDNDFRRMAIHQKPNNIGELYISLFGEPVIQNWYYTYNIKDRSFKKVNLDYFKFDVGVDHIKHYGQDVLFQNLVSHKTGDQNFNPETGNFNMSITNGTTEKSYETEPGYVPNGGPLLQFNNKIIYSGSGVVNEEGIADNAFVSIIDCETEQVKYMYFDKKSTEYYPIYTTDEHAYIIGNEGKLIVLDKDFNYKSFDVFKDLPSQFYYYIHNGTLLLNEDTALHILYNEENGSSMGLLKFDEVPTFTLLEKDYINNKMDYRILYQDMVKGEIYLIESDGKKRGNLLILDNHNFELKNKIPVEYHHLLDFVVKI